MTPQERDRLIAEYMKKRELLVSMIEVAIPIGDADPLQKVSSAMYRIARNTLRRNIMRVQSGAVLLTYDKMSDSALEIARNVIEDAISLSYLLSDKDPEKMAMQFFEFRWVQAKFDHDYYSKIPDYMGAELWITKEKIDSEYSRVVKMYPEFLDKFGQPRRSWTKQGIMGMMKQLVVRKVYSKAERDNILRAYEIGSRKTHFNPDNILEFHDQEAWNLAQLKSTEHAIRALASGFMSIIVRYYDTLWYYKPKHPGIRNIQRLYKLQSEINKDA